jgi:hypothetical protein
MRAASASDGSSIRRVSSSAGSLDRAAVSSALWARSVAINLLALFVCRLLLDDFELHGVWAYALAAVCIELPTLLWLLTVQFWQTRAFSDPAVLRGRVSQLVWVVALFALSLVVPLALATSVPGLLVAEWISPLAINGFWTYRERDYNGSHRCVPPVSTAQVRFAVSQSRGG